MSEKFEVKDGLKIPSGKQLELNNVTLSGISNDTSLSGSSSSDLVTEFAVKSYVDSNNQWTLSDGTSSTVVDTGNTLQINGTDNEVNVEVDHNNDAFSIGLPASVEIETKLTTAELSATGTVTLADGAALASNAAPTADAGIANKKYVDDQLGSTAMSAATDSGNMNPIDLDSEVLTLTGGEGMNVTHSGNTVTFAGEDASATNKGVASFDSTDFTVTSGDVAVNAERVQDIVGGMVTGDSAQSGIAVSYDDVQNVLDFNVADPTITISGDVSGSATMNNLGDVTINVAQQADSVDLTTHTTGNYVATITGGTGLTSTGATTGEGIAHSLSVDATQNHITSANSLTTVGALNAGSITSDFGSIDIGASTLAAGNTTIAGTISASGRLTVGSIADATSTATTAAPTDDKHIANKKYVDDQLGASALSATIGETTHSIDLDSESISYAGTTNEVDVSSSADGSGNVTVTYGLPNDVSITGNLSAGDSKLFIAGTAMTASAAELNKLTDNAVSAADLTKLSQTTATSAELNMLDGGTSATEGVTVADADRLILNDNGTMKQIAMSDFEVYFETALDTLNNVTSASSLATVGTITSGTWQGSKINNAYVDSLSAGTVTSGTFADGRIAESNVTQHQAAITGTGALASGSIASGFGTITTLSACNLGATTVDSMDVSNGGITQAGSIAGATTIDGTGDLTMGSITMTGFSVGTTGLATMLSGSKLSSSSADAVTANADIANKAYVDSVVNAADLDFTVDGTSYDLDLDSQSIAISGTANEIEITDSEAEGVISLQLGLPNDVTIGQDLSVTRNATVTGTMTQTGKATFAVEAEFNGGIDCDGQLSMEGNDIVGTADNMLLQADDETSHTFEGTDKMALQALSGIEMVNNVKFSADIESNIIPDANGTRTLGDSSNHWNITYTNRVDLQNARIHSFSSTPTSDDASAIMTFAHADFKSAKVSLNVKSGNNYTAREVIIVCDENGANAKLVEYGILSTGSELGTLSVATNGANIELRVEDADDMPCTGVVSFIE